MSEKFDMVGLESIQNKYLDGRNVKNCAETTSAAIDEEVLRIIKQCHKKAIELLEQNQNALHNIAKFLLEKETITGQEFMTLLKQCNETIKKELI